MSTRKKNIDLQIGAFLDAWSGRDGAQRVSKTLPSTHLWVLRKLGDEPTPGTASIWLSAFFFIL